MTIRSFGQITPLQGHMLLLAGYGPSEEDGVRDLVRLEQDTKIIEQIRNGAVALQNATQQNLGFSLIEWHNFLLNDPKLSRQYMWPRAWKQVSKAISGEIDNPDRSRLEDLAQIS